MRERPYPVVTSRRPACSAMTPSALSESAPLGVAEVYPAAPSLKPAPATVCAGKTTGDLRPYDDATRGFAADRGDAGLTPRQTNGATWREP